MPIARVAVIEKSIMSNERLRALMKFQSGTLNVKNAATAKRARASERSRRVRREDMRGREERAACIPQAAKGWPCGKLGGEDDCVGHGAIVPSDWCPVPVILRHENLRGGGGGVRDKRGPVIFGRADFLLHLTPRC